MPNTLTSIASLLRLAAPIAALLLASANLYAQQTHSLSLTGSAEVPPVSTSATGSGRITVRPDRSVSGTIRTAGFEPTMAHIHEAATGQNGPAIVTLERTGSDSFAVPSDTRLTDAQYVSYQAGHLYINVHSSRHPSGEIRAQLMRVETAGMPAHKNY